MLFALVAAAHAAEPQVHVELSHQVMPDTVTLDLRGRYDGEHDGYLMGAMRVDPTGCWIGRTGIGVDVFGGRDGLDLKLGLFLGGVGDLSPEGVAVYGRPAAGGEIQLGMGIGRVYGYLRHVDGFAGPLEDRLTENELRLGFRLTDHVKVHGQYLVYNPGDAVQHGGGGLGVEVFF